MNVVTYRALALTLIGGLMQGCGSEEAVSEKSINDQPDSSLAAEYMSAIAGVAEGRLSPLSKLNCSARVVSAVSGYDIGTGERVRTRVYYVLLREDGKLFHADSCGGSPSECTSIIEARARSTCPVQ